MCKTWIVLCGPIFINWTLQKQNNYTIYIFLKGLRKKTQENVTYVMLNPSLYKTCELIRLKNVY